MIFTFPLQKYLRSQQPPIKESQQTYIEEELKKLERTLATMHAALQEIATKVP